MQWGDVEPIDATTCRITMAVDWFEWPMMLLADIGAEFEVEGPVELADMDPQRRGALHSRRVRRGGWLSHEVAPP